MYRFKASEMYKLGDFPSTNDTFVSFNEAMYSQGCFIVSDCFDQDFIKKAHNSLVKLFSKPESEKLKYKIDKVKNPLGAGFSPFGNSHALDTGIANLLETWDISPVKENWPKDMGEEWNTLMDYQRQLFNIARNSLKLVEKSLEVPKGEIAEIINEKNGGIHFIHYFPLKEGFDEGARRQSEHCDNTLITLIPPPHPVSTGISVFDRKDNKWKKEVIGENECLVQAGLLLERITNQAIRANLHTVNNPEVNSPENVSRYSTPFFLSPSGDYFLKVLDKFRNDEALKKFPDKSVSEIQKDYFDKIFRS